MNNYSISKETYEEDIRQLQIGQKYQARILDQHETKLEKLETKLANLEDQIHDSRLREIVFTCSLYGNGDFVVLEN